MQGATYSLQGVVTVCNNQHPIPKPDCASCIKQHTHTHNHTPSIQSFPSSVLASSAPLEMNNWVVVCSVVCLHLCVLEVGTSLFRDSRFFGILEQNRAFWAKMGQNRAFLFRGRAEMLRACPYWRSEGLTREGQNRPQNEIKYFLWVGFPHFLRTGHQHF